MSNDLSRRSAGAQADRDRVLEQALTQELRAQTLPVTPQCLDAETLAAWEDGGLDAVAMQDAEIHVSSCARCQSMLAAIAKATPATEPVPESKSIFSWHWWFAPIAATAAAVTLWMVVPDQQQLATAPPSAAAPAREVAAQQPAGNDNTGAQPRTNDAAPIASPQNATKPTESLEERAQAPVETFAAREDRRERQAPPPTARDAVGTAASRESAAAGADAAALAAAAPPPPLPAQAPSPAAPSPPAPAPAAAATLQKRLAVAPVEVISTDGVRRWRAVTTGIEYSADRGLSWIPVRAVGNEVITGGVAASGTICWLIGRSGAVLVTVDGMTFAKVDLPVRVDVTSIAATDARTAVVTTADGRTFHTDDSGRNWRQN